MDKLVKKFIRMWLKLPQSTTFNPLLHRRGLNIKLPSYLYDHGHLVIESNPLDEVVESAIELQHRAATTRATDGFGTGNTDLGELGFFARCTLTKVR